MYIDKYNHLILYSNLTLLTFLEIVRLRLLSDYDGVTLFSYHHTLWLVDDAATGQNVLTPVLTTQISQQNMMSCNRICQ